MNLQSSNKVDVTFNMASMTDVVFLLLIFFMLTSSFVTPSSLPISLPSSKTSVIKMHKVSVAVTKNLAYYVNDVPVPKQLLEQKLKELLFGNDRNVVVLFVDKSVPTQELIYVAGIATALKAKVSIATKTSE